MPIDAACFRCRADDGATIATVQTHKEKVMEEKLLKSRGGLVLLRGKHCPSCETSLVKLVANVDEAVMSLTMASFDDGFNGASIEKEGNKPIYGVPFCIICKAHVVSESSDVQMLLEAARTQTTSTLALKGSIFVASNKGMDFSDFEKADQAMLLSALSSCGSNLSNSIDFDGKHLTTEQELMIELFQAASCQSTLEFREGVEVSLIPHTPRFDIDDDEDTADDEEDVEVRDGIEEYLARTELNEGKPTRNEEASIKSPPLDSSTVMATNKRLTELMMDDDENIDKTKQAQSGSSEEIMSLLKINSSADLGDEIFGLSDEGQASQGNSSASQKGSHDDESRESNAMKLSVNEDLVLALSDPSRKSDMMLEKLIDKMFSNDIEDQVGVGSPNAIQKVYHEDKSRKCNTATPGGDDDLILSLSNQSKDSDALLETVIDNVFSYGNAPPVRKTNNNRDDVREYESNRSVAAGHRKDDQNSVQLNEMEITVNAGDASSRVKDTAAGISDNSLNQNSSVQSGETAKEDKPEFLEFGGTELNRSGPFFSDDHKGVSTRVSDEVRLTVDVIPEYTVRRDIATKVLGAKMLQGYSLTEQLCKVCSMPMMESDKRVICVVCPFLKKRALKLQLLEEREREICQLAQQKKSGEIQNNVSADEIHQCLATNRSISTVAMSELDNRRTHKPEVKYDRVENMKEERSGLLLPQKGDLNTSKNIIGETDIDRSQTVVQQSNRSKEDTTAPSTGEANKHDHGASEKSQPWKELALATQKEAQVAMDRARTALEHRSCTECANEYLLVGDTPTAEIDTKESGSRPSPEELSKGQMNAKAPSACVVQGLSEGFQALNHHYNLEGDNDKPSTFYGNRSVMDLQSHFESKRALVCEEIGKRMMRGWTLLDLACPFCVMPLMTDPRCVDEVCVLCGFVGRKGNGPRTSRASKEDHKPKVPHTIDPIVAQNLPEELVAMSSLLPNSQDINLGRRDAESVDLSTVVMPSDSMAEVANDEILPQLVGDGNRHEAALSSASKTSVDDGAIAYASFLLSAIKRFSRETFPRNDPPAIKGFTTRKHAVDADPVIPSSFSMTNTLCDETDVTGEGEENRTDGQNRIDVEIHANVDAGDGDTMEVHRAESGAVDQGEHPIKTLSEDPGKSLEECTNAIEEFVSHSKNSEQGTEASHDKPQTSDGTNQAIRKVAAEAATEGEEPQDEPLVEMFRTLRMAKSDSDFLTRRIFEEESDVQDTQSLRDMLTLEISSDFDFSNEQHLRRLIRAAKDTSSICEGELTTESKRPLPSPGMIAASAPQPPLPSPMSTTTTPSSNVTSSGSGMRHSDNLALRSQKSGDRSMYTLAESRDSENGEENPVPEVPDKIAVKSSGALSSVELQEGMVPSPESVTTNAEITAASQDGDVSCTARNGAEKNANRTSDDSSDMGRSRVTGKSSSSSTHRASRASKDRIPRYIKSWRSATSASRIRSQKGDEEDIIVITEEAEKRITAEQGGVSEVAGHDQSADHLTGLSDGNMSHAGMSKKSIQSRSKHSERSMNASQRSIGSLSRGNGTRASSRQRVTPETIERSRGPRLYSLSQDSSTVSTMIDSAVSRQHFTERDIQRYNRPARALPPPVPIMVRTKTKKMRDTDSQTSVGDSHLKVINLLGDMAPSYDDAPVVLVEGPTDSDFRSTSSSNVSVSSAALDALMDRIEETKAKLEAKSLGKKGVRDQAQLRELIENLALAAEEMQKLER